jgi:exopolysaccharide biosynthesis protein
LILISVDGRSPKQAEGINILELTHLLKVLGVEYALNLDGGGSTTLWSKDAPENGVLNMPSDNKKFDHFGERKISNLIIIKNK